MEIKEKAQSILESELLPYLGGHGGSAKIADYEDGILYVKLLGACAGCPSADLGTKQMIEEALLKEIPELKEVRIYNPVDQEMLDLARKMLNLK